MNNNEFAGFEEETTTKPVVTTGAMLQWFNKLSTIEDELAAGWHLATANCTPELTKILTDLDTTKLTIEHQSGNTVEYWSLKTCSLIFLCSGFADTWTMKQNPEQAKGLAYGWNKRGSKLKIQCFIGELIAKGDSTIFTISLERMITDKFIDVLQEQFRVQEAYEQIYGHVAPYCGHMLKIGPAKKTIKVGKNGVQGPILPFIPYVPETIDKAYLEKHRTPKRILDMIREEKLLQKAYAWSVDTSLRISANEDRESYEALPQETLSHASYQGYDDAPEEIATAERNEAPVTRNAPMLAAQKKAIETMSKDLGVKPPNNFAQFSEEQAAEKIKELAKAKRQR